MIIVIDMSLGYTNYNGIPIIIIFKVTKDDYYICSMLAQNNIRLPRNEYKSNHSISSAYGTDTNIA